MEKRNLLKSEIKWKPYLFVRYLNYRVAPGYDDTDTSSLGYRINGLWPAVVKSINGPRFAFGWGHIGVSYIPYGFFDHLSEFKYAEASCEGQYIDVLQRQGFVGLFFFVSILVTGIIYSNRLACMSTERSEYIFWLSSLAWQVGALSQAGTTETTRFPMYSLFYFLFLGMMSNQYRLANKDKIDKTNPTL